MSNSELPSTARGDRRRAKQDSLGLTGEDIARIIEARHDDPHSVLGPHADQNGTSTAVRAFLPWASSVALHVDGQKPAEYPMTRIHSGGLFECVFANNASSIRYHFVIHDAQGRSMHRHDAYAVSGPWFTTEDERLFTAGLHYRAFDKLGAHLQQRDGLHGTQFAVWAPHAGRVSVVGTFNGWDGRQHPMRRLRRSGVWELFIPDVAAGALYKFEIRAPAGHILLRTDPFARRTEAAPDTASIVVEQDTAAAEPSGAAASRSRAMPKQMARIGWPTVDEISLIRTSAEGDQTERIEGLIAAWKTKGLSHIVMPHGPNQQPTLSSAFALADERGARDAVKAFAENCRSAGLGVIVPVMDSDAPQRYPELNWFDGTQLFEAADGSASGTAGLAIDRPEIQSFLLSNAFFWLDHYHADGWLTDGSAERVIRALRELAPERTSNALAIVSPPKSSDRLQDVEIHRLLTGRHDAPHAVLGPHRVEGTDDIAIRAFVPRAEHVYARFGDESETLHELRRVHPDGLFETRLDHRRGVARYRLLAESAEGIEEFGDAHAFREFSFSDADLHLFAAGKHYRIYEKLGAHLDTVAEVHGVRFAVWAPNAEGVSVIGAFNRWDGHRHPMHRHGLSGVWETFVPDLTEGALYKFEIHARNGQRYVKSDPYAFFAERSPATASIVYRLDDAYSWRDQAWMQQRSVSRPWEQPVAIYEVHLGSWLRDAEQNSLSYLELARQLIPHVRELGFTHIELLPVSEYPYEPSWGYQVTGYYAPTSRYGRPEDLMQFIDLCHQSGIGVLLDWVPGHFPKDAHGLAWFDGTGLYEHADPRKGEHRDWGTLVFNYGRREVENFLVANALFWLEHYHFDGLRVDAVASMLYLDYSRTQPGEWIPNQYGGRENLEAIEFLQHTNVVVHRHHPGVMMVAEESTAWPGVSRTVDQGGLGFGYKWNMGWMHDVLDYMSVPAQERMHHHHRLTFGLVYAFAENYVLSLSHDEVVHMKRSLLNKMPGGEWEQFANLRLLYGLMYAHPGKKLLFMGAEFGQRGEWNHAGSLEWHLLEQEPHRRLQRFVQDINTLYRAEPALFEVDFKGVGFEWLQADNADECIVAFLRKAKDPRNTLLFIMNFSGVSRPYYRVGVPYPVAFQPICHSNAATYGGADRESRALPVEAEEIPWNEREFSIALPLPALSAIILRPAPPRL